MSVLDPFQRAQELIGKLRLREAGLTPVRVELLPKDMQHAGGRAGYASRAHGAT